MNPAPRRVLAWATVAYFASLATGWRLLAGTGAGVIRYFHLPMLVVMALAPQRWALYTRLRALAGACVVYTVVLVGFSWYHASPPVVMQQGVYLGAAFMAGAFLRVATLEELRILRWAGPLAVALFLVLFWMDAAAIGIDPVRTYQFAVLSGDLNLIQFGLFQQVFNAASPPGVINSTALRGQIFAGILVALALSHWARSHLPRSGLFDAILLVSMGLGGLLAVLSLARALQLAAVLAVALPLVRALLRARAGLGVVVLGALGAMILVLSVATPVAGFILDRVVSDRGSYAERGSAFTAGIDRVMDEPLLGAGTQNDAVALAGDRTALTSHNFVLDAAVLGGVVGGMLATIVLVLILRLLIRAFKRYLDDDVLFGPLAAALLVPVVMFTSGSGTLQMPELLGLALLCAALLRSEESQLGDDVDLEDDPQPSEDHEQRHYDTRFNAFAPIEGSER